MLIKNTKDICVNEENYTWEMQNKILPYVSKIKQTGNFQTFDGINLFYKKFEPQNINGTIVIVHGFSENTDKYNELIYYFLRENYAVYIYDQRCHGFSQKLLANPEAIHVDKFDDYAHDLNYFLERIILNRDNKRDGKIFLFGHSMGGAVIARFLEIDQPNYLKSVILSAPMFEIKIKSNESQIKYLDMQSNNDDKYCFYIAGQEITLEDKLRDIWYRSYKRYVYVINEEAKNNILHKGLISFSWLKQAFWVTEKIFESDSIKKINLLDLKILLFQYGKDQTVGENNQNKFTEVINKCELYKINSARHNIYFMHNNLLNQFLNKIFAECTSV